MSNPIFDQSFVVYIDSEVGHDLVASTSGPAGSAFLHLSGGVTIEMDYARPEQLVALHVEPGASQDLLADLVGTTRAASVHQFVERADGRPYRLLDERSAALFDDRIALAPVSASGDDIEDPDVISGEELDRNIGRFGSNPMSMRSSRDAYNSRMIGRLALLQTASMDPALSPLAHACALLELAAAVEGGEFGRIPAINELIEPAVTRAGSLLTGLHSQWRELVADQPAQADELLTLFTRFGRRNDDCRKAAKLLERARRWHWRDDSSWHQAGTSYGSPLPSDELAMRRMARSAFPNARAAATSEPAPEFAALARHTIDSIIAEATPPFLEPVPDHHVSLAYGGRLTVRSFRPRADEWLRVLHVQTLVLVALVPMLEDDDGDWGAEALIPPDLDVTDIVIEITRDPLPSETAMVRTREAIHLGREAVLAGARNKAFRARELWRLAARAWEELGDTTRARLAQQYSMDRQKERREDSLAEQLV